MVCMLFPENIMVSPLCLMTRSFGHHDAIGPYTCGPQGLLSTGITTLSDDEELWTSWCHRALYLWAPWALLGLVVHGPLCGRSALVAALCSSV